MAAVIICSDLGVPENNMCHCLHFPCFYLPWSNETGWHNLSCFFFFLRLSFKPSFWLSSFTLIKRLFSSSLLSAIRVVYLPIWVCWYFSQQCWFQLVIHPAQHIAWCTLHRSLKNGVKMYSLIFLFSQLFPVIPCSFLTIASWPMYLSFLGDR